MKTKSYKMPWLKLWHHSIFGEEGDFVSNLPNHEGDVIFMIYIRLCYFARNDDNDGLLRSKVNGFYVNFNAEKIKKDLKHYSFMEITKALEVLIRIGFVYIHETGAYGITNYLDIAGGETPDARRKRLKRAELKEIKSEEQADNVPDNVRPLTQNEFPLISKDIRNENERTMSRTMSAQEDIRSRDIENIRNKEVKEDGEVENKSSTSTSDNSSNSLLENKETPSQVLALFNQICTNLTPIRAIGPKRNATIEMLLLTNSLEDFKTVFEKASSTDFLNGNNERGFKASFDWLIKYETFTKVLEGGYDPFVPSENKKTKSANKDDEYTDEEVKKMLEDF